MEHNRSIDQFKQQINPQMLKQAFVTPEAIGMIARARCFIDDCGGALIMHGSFVNGRCTNPRSHHYLKEPDEGRRSDLDLVLIDGVFFSELPFRERCWYESFPPPVRGKITHSLMYPDGRVKDFLKKPGTPQHSLYLWLSELRHTTGRKIDFRVCEGWGTWHFEKGNYWLLANARRSYVEEM